MTRFTERLRLEPIGAGHTADLLLLHQDPGIARWYGPWTETDAADYAAASGRAWRHEAVHKWLAYDRGTGELIGRGGLSYKDVDGARRLELGWAVRECLWGNGYATEIGRAGLVFAFGELSAAEVVAFTDTHNERCRAVIQRLGFHDPRDIRYLGEPFVLYVLGAPPRLAW
jgi:RimJ/RimL family protein N-acetyltransferase